MTTSATADPPSLAAAQELLGQGRIVEAQARLQAMRARWPDDGRLALLSAMASLAADAPHDALAALRQAVGAGLQPQLALRLELAQVLVLLMRPADARTELAQAEVLAAGDAHALRHAARLYLRCDDPAAAARVFRAARSAGLADPALAYELASALYFMGELDQAEAELDALLAHRPMSAHALYLRATLRRQTVQRNHVPALRRAIAEGFADPAQAGIARVALARELEDLGEDRAAFATLAEGARMLRATLQYDAANERADLDRIIAAWDAEALAQAPAPQPTDCIFVVGMPRTGTTLGERILGCHPRVRSAGELPFFGQLLGAASGQAMRASRGRDGFEASRHVDFAALGRDWLAAAHQAAPDADIVLDKMPVNFMYCGMIRRALPGARIVHMRRQPMDACYAMYKTWFHRAYHFSWDLQELAAYYAAYARLMAHWRLLLGDTLLDIDYEALVANPEAQARRMLAHCGLDWDPRVLEPESDSRPSSTASAAQVRAPIHARSVGLWRRFEDELRPLREALQAHGIDVH